MFTSEVLNKAADHIEERGWGQGPASMYGQAGVCVMGAIHLAQFGRVNEDADYNGVHLCKAGQAVYRYLVEAGRARDFDVDTMWEWNDSLSEESGAAEVVEVLRAAAVIEAAREEQDAAWLTYAELVSA